LPDWNTFFLPPFSTPVQFIRVAPVHSLNRLPNKMNRGVAMETGDESANRFKETWQLVSSCGEDKWFLYGGPLHTL